MSQNIHMKNLLILEENLDKKVRFLYKNYRGETSERKVKIISTREGNTEWHQENQLLLKAFDLNKNAEREFVIKDILSEIKPL